MAERWTLSRAGITNVYQYTDEVLRFGGGRLLLRGVNGSGKSTAMNMLLPFLLDADVRRIDAAGDQAGVLRSWMLAGRDETQPTGYLWLEMARGDEHLAFGCGIKANRNTGNVTHWWFVTDRRPGIDLHLVRTRGPVRTPLSAEELRQELGAGHVWAMDQRPAYRAALHGRLYGGADLDQHVRLLHIVRNPRVGDRVDDRVDLGLTAHLHDALPQLSEAAIDDAATPLEQLDEHRRNVSDLAGTVGTLEALLATYRDHVRSTLRAQAETALTHVTEHRARERAARQAVEAEAAARAAVGELTASIAGLEVDERRLDGEIKQLEASEAYTSASDLVLRREAVANLAKAAAHADDLRVARADDAEGDRGGVEGQARAVAGQVTDLHDELTALAGLVTEATLPAEVPARPEVAVAPLTVGDDVVTVPATDFSTDGLAHELAAVRSAAQGRSEDVGQAQAAFGRVDAALDDLKTAEGRLVDAQRDLDRATEQAETATAELTATAGRWRVDATDWLVALGTHVDASGVEMPTPIDLSEADVPADHERLHAALLASVDAVLDAHRKAQAAIESRLATAEEARDEAQREVDDLAAREVPDPPVAPWQGDRAGPCLAEVVDFAPDLDEGERAGLEAALEASGLLMAEVRADGALVVGDLLVRPGPATEAPLSRHLGVSVPAEHETLSPAAVQRTLDTISTEDTGLDADDGAAVVTTSGRFRIGPLVGRHSKPTAEHVGVTARRAALERMRRDAADRLAEAHAAVEQVEGDLVLAREHVDTATDLRRAVPATAPLLKAVATAEAADGRRADAAEERDHARQRRDEAEDRHGRAVDDAHRTCVTSGLPHDRAALATVAEACRQVPAQADAVRKSAAQLARAVTQWTQAGRRWARSQEAARDAARRADTARDEHGTAVAELATLEDALDLDVDELFATIDHAKGELKETRAELKAARDEVGPAEKRHGIREAAVGRTKDEVEQSEAHSVEALGRLRAALAVPGLWAAAIAATDQSDGTDQGDGAGPGGLPVVAESTAGLRALATAVADLVPPPTLAVTHDGVRNALLQRRATLGAGWDAVSVHPEPDLPLAVEVTGPLGQMPLATAAAVASEQLASKRGLLTAQQTDALHNLLQGLVANEVAEKMHGARELVDGMNGRLREVRTTHGIGTSLRWRRGDDLTDDLSAMVDLLAKPPDLRTPDEDARLVAALSTRIADARINDPEADYRTLIARVLDYREWFRMQVVVHRPGVPEAVLSRRTPLSEGEKKIVTYQPLFAAVAASCDALAETASDAPRFVLLDDAFAKVSEDNHPKLFGLLVELDLDFIATSERLWGTHATVPELAITEVVRDADAGVIVLEHSHWDGSTRTEAP